MSSDEAAAAQEKTNTSGSCIFVRGIPYEATSQQLETFFSEIGPLKTCFVVADKEKEASNKGFGFVTFAMKEDAQKALADLKAVKFLGQRTLLMELAVRRSTDPKDKPAKKEKPAPTPPKTKKNPHPSTIPVKARASTFVEISKLPEGLEVKQLHHKVRKMGTVLDIVFPVVENEETRAGIAHVKYQSATDAQSAVSKLNNHVFKGVTIFAKLVEKAKGAITVNADASEETPQAGKPRLIIRNLSFQSTEAHVRKAFAAHGTVKFVNFPTKPDKKGTPIARGFAFVHMASLEEAEKAMGAVNGTKIAGRVVAVDWAMPKEWYAENAAADEAKNQEASEVEAENDDDDAAEEEEEEEEEGVDESADTMDVDGGDQEDEDEMNTSDVDADVEVGDDAEEDESDNEVGDESMEDDEDDEVEITLDDEEIDDEESTAKVSKPPALSAKVEEGCTLFVRNLLFETTDEELKARFMTFGRIRYARVTKDPTTGRSRGTGFVCFYNKPEADACMEAYEAAAKSHSLLDSVLEKPAADPRAKNQKDKKEAKGQSKSMLVPEPSLTSAVTAPFILGERFLNLTVAVSKQESAKLTSEGVKDRRANDRRHMYLIKEGVIFQNSKEAEGILPTELSKRQKSYTERKRLLASNPNLFLSRTRLSVRNLGLKVAEYGLKRAAILSVKRFWEEVKARKRKGLEEEVLEEDKQDGLEPPGTDRRIIVKTSKIMLDNTKIDPVTKKGRSKGFGFLEFENHSDALACLRYMNANPFVFKADGLPYSHEEILTFEAGEASEADLTAVNKSRRPIVEFSVENRTILKKKEELVQKQRDAAKEAKKNGGVAPVKADKGGKGKAEVAKKDGKKDGKKDAKKDGKKDGGKKGSEEVASKGKDNTDKKRKREPASAAPDSAKKAKKAAEPESEAAVGKKQKKDKKGKGEKNAASGEPAKVSKSKMNADREQQDDKDFTQLLAKYGKGMFGAESKMLK
ncbi:RNA recognition motif-containing protein [Chytriomyces hyalinus]|nr:RNA recognition motif-containing protein [Chytriomyces hyalinus]